METQTDRSLEDKQKMSRAVKHIQTHGDKDSPEGAAKKSLSSSLLTSHPQLGLRRRADQAQEPAALTSFQQLLDQTLIKEHRVNLSGSMSRTGPETFYSCFL